MKELIHQLHAALSALHSGDETLYRQSNEWLDGFFRSKAAWETCMELYKMDVDVSIKFSCLSILVRKTKRDWMVLSVQEKDAMQQQFRYVCPCTSF